MENRGGLGVVLAVHDRKGGAPRHYTIGAGARHAADWAMPDGRYDLVVTGPNGFLRGFAGGIDTPFAATIAADGDAAAVVTLSNHGTEPRRFTIRLDPAYRPTGRAEEALLVPAGGTARSRWDLARSDGWCDLSVGVEGDSAFRRRFAGHVDPRRQQRTDPAIGPMRLHV
jgi:phospholipase C